MSFEERTFRSVGVGRKRRDKDLLVSVSVLSEFYVTSENRMCFCQRFSQAIDIAREIAGFQFASNLAKVYGKMLFVEKRVSERQREYSDGVSICWLFLFV